MNDTIQEYNTLVEEWNKKYTEKIHKISPNNVQESKLDQITQFFTSDEPGERRKVKLSVDTVSSFANMTDSIPDSDTVQKKELAYIIKLKGEEILKKT